MSELDEPKFSAKADTRATESEVREQSEPTRLQSEVLSKLRSLIETGGFTEGSRLPPERALAAQLGVSRPALREGIKALSILDVLESRRGAGTFVKSSAGLESGWLNRELSRTAIDSSMLELIEVRKIIEPRAAALAAARATEQQLRDIAQVRVALESEVVEGPTMAKLDYDYHTAIITASGNRILIELNRVLTPLLVQSRSITTQTSVDRDKMHSEHYAIFHAIVCGQSDAAEQTMLKHLHTVGVDLISERRR